MANIKSNNKLIFADVCYFLASECSDQVKQLLKQGGATKEYYISDLVTHVLSDTSEFPLVSEANEYNLPIVTQNWVTMSVKADMMLPTKPFSQRDDNLFAGMTVCPSKIPCDDLTKLWAMITFYGGQCQLNLTPSCTHLVIPEMTGDKYAAADKTDGKIKIVTPSWVIDSITKNKLLDIDQYRPSLKEIDTKEKPESEKKPVSLDVTMTTSDVTSTTTVALPIAAAHDTFKMPDLSEVTMMTDTKSRSDQRAGKDDIGEVCVRETPVKTAGQSSFGDQTDKSRQESGADELVPSDNRNEEKMICADYGIENVGQKSPSQSTGSLLAGYVFVVSDYQDNIDHSILETWIEVIKSNGGQVEPFYTNRCTHLLCTNQCGKLYSKVLSEGKKIVTAHWLNEILTEQRVIVPFNPLHFPVPFLHKLPEAKSLTITVTGYTGAERFIVKNMIYTIGAAYTGYLTRSNTQIICKNSEGEKYAKAREWGIPCVNAKWLGDIVSAGKLSPCALKKYSVFGDPDDLTANKDHVNHLLELWKDDPIAVNSAPATIDATKGKKRKQDETKDSELDAQAKKPRFSVEVNGNTPRVLFTGLPLGKSAALIKMLAELGGITADSHRTCTHLVSTKIIRTVKFLSAISICQFIVSPEWLEQSYESKQFLDPKSFGLKDAETENEYKMQLSTSIERAQARPLLEDVQVYATQNVQPSPSSLKEIVECAGGQFLTSVPSKAMLKSLKEAKTSQGNPAFLVVTCQEDLRLCDVFIKCDVVIHSTEVILAGVLTQQIDYETYKVKFV